MQVFDRPKVYQGAVLLLTLALVLGTVITPSVLAGTPWFAGPSAIAVGEARVFKGGGFIPNAVLNIQVRDAQGSVYVQSTTVSAQGDCAYEITPAVGGSHTVTVMQENGDTLAETRFGAY